MITMAYIQRDDTGKIVAIFDDQQAHAQEYMPLDSLELIEDLTHSTADNDAKSKLAISDTDLVRVIEDLIYTLIDKKVILFTDLPEAARDKLMAREAIRGHLTDLDKIVDDNEGLL